LQSAREEDVPARSLAGHDIVGYRDVATLQPEAVALVAKVLHILAAFDSVARAERMDGDVAVKGADLVTSFSDEGRAHGVEHDVPFNVDVAAVVHDSPARRVDDGTVDNRRRCGVLVDAGAMEVHSVTTARVQAASCDLELRDAIHHHWVAV